MSLPAIETSAQRWCVGTENENGVLVRSTPTGPTRTLGRQELASIIHGAVPADIPCVRSARGEALSNGGIVYPDQEAFESCTPEATSIGDLILNELAMEGIVAEMLANAAETADQWKYFSQHRRVLSDDHQTTGYHMNHCMPSEYFEITPPRLIPMLAHALSRSGYCGAGAIRRYLIDNRRMEVPGEPRAFAGSARFVVAQKLLTAQRDFHGDTLNGNKPLVNLRNEPLALPEFTRFHDVSSDPTRPWGTFMNAGTTKWVLRLCCDPQYKNPKFDFEKPAYESARPVSWDLTLKHKIALARGGSITTPEIQAELLKGAQGIRHRYDETDEDKQLFPEWERAVDILLREPLALSDADWVIKYQLLHRKIDEGRSWDDLYGMHLEMDRHGSPALQKLREHGYKLAAKRGLHLEPSAEALADRRINPPTTTRAKVRGEFVRRLQGSDLHRLTPFVAWDMLYLPSERHRLDDPFETEMQPALAEHLAELGF